MFHINDPKVRDLLLKGNFGLEKESLRITTDGHLSHTDHPFNDDHIVRDFAEIQTEINTPVFDSEEKALESLQEYTDKILVTLHDLPEREYLWPFSNPPFITNEEDIRIAKFYGENASKTEYRNYLSDRYGRYKMVLSGIHVNFSFSDELLEADFALSEETDFRTYKDQLYVGLAEKAVAFGWIMTALTAASPVMDRSFSEKGRFGWYSFNGMASVRCSELGYWNSFTPHFDYSNIEKYCDSMQFFVDEEWIAYPSELYYPIRLKPPGANSLDALREKGVNHIELRMVDLNPLEEAGLNLKDLKFAHLLLTWLASTPRFPFSAKDQIMAAQNFKNAAHYDLKTVKIVGAKNKRQEAMSVADAGIYVIEMMERFYADFGDEVKEILAFEKEKFVDPDKRYSWKIMREYGDEFVLHGLRLAKKRQKDAVARQNAMRV